MNSRILIHGFFNSKTLPLNVELRSDVEIKSEFLTTITQANVTNACKDPSAFIDLFQHLDNLQTTVTAKPEYKSELFHALIEHATRCEKSNDNKFNDSFMRCSDDFIKLAGIFPDGKAELFEKIVRRTKFIEFINYSYIALANLARTFDQDSMRQNLIDMSGLNTRVGYNNIILQAAALEVLASVFTQHRELLIAPLLRDSTIRARMCTNFVDLIVLARAFPTEHTALLRVVFENLAEYKKNVVSAYILYSLASIFPANHAELLLPLLTDQALRTRFIKSGSDLVELAQKFPTQQAAIISSVLNNSTEFFRVITSCIDLQNLGKAFPTTQADLLPPVLNSQTLRARYIEDGNDLAALGAVFTEYRSALIDPLLTDPIEFERIIKSDEQLIALAKAFPDHQTILLRLVLMPKRTEQIQSIQEFALNPASLSNAVLAREKLQGLALTTNALIMMTNAFPNFSSDFIDPVLTRLDIYHSVVSIWEDLNRLGKIFPQHRPALLQHVLADRAEWSRLIKTTDALVEMSATFAEHQAQLLQPVFDDNVLCARIVRNCHDLVALGKAFPNQKSKIINTVLNDFAAYQRIINFRTLLEILSKIFTEDHHLLINPIVTIPTERARLVEDANDLAALGAAFANYQSQLIDPVLNDDAEYYRLVQSRFELTSLVYAFPSYHAALLRPVLNNKAVRARFILERTDLVSLGKALPTYHAELLCPVLADKEQIARFILDSSDLIILGDIFTNYQSALADIVLREPSRYRQIIKVRKDLKRLGRAFPASVASLLRPILTDKNERERLLTNGKELVKLCKAFPNYTSALIEPVLNDATEYSRIIVELDDLAALGAAFPAHQGILLGPVLTDSTLRSRFINNGASLAILGSAFPLYQTELIDPLLRNLTEYRRVIVSRAQLVEVADAFPAYKAALIAPILNDTSMHAKTITDGLDLIALAYAFPNHHSALLAHLVTDPEVREKFIPNQRMFGSIFEAFPGHEDVLMELILTNIADRVRLIKSSSDLINFVKKHPKYRDAILNAVLSNLVDYARIIKTCHDLEALAAEYPTYQHKLTQPLLTDKSLRQTIICDGSDLSGLDKVFADNYSALIEVIISDSEEYRRIFGSYVHLKIIGGAHPALQASLLGPLIADRTEWSRLIGDCDELIELAQIFTGQQTKLLEPLLINTAEQLRIVASGRNLINLVKAFPAFKTELLRPVLTNPAERVRIIEKAATMIRLSEAFPEHADTLFGPVLTDPSERERLITSGHVLALFCSSYPAHRTALVSPLLTDLNELQRLISTCASLDAVLTVAPDIKIQLLAIIQDNDSNIMRLIQSIYDLGYLCDAIPSQREKCAEFVFASDDVFFSGTLYQVADLVYFVKIFPEHAERIYKRVSAIGLRAFEIVTDFNSIKNFIRLYPAHKTDVVAYMLDNVETIIQLLKNSNKALPFLLTIFPERRQKLISIAASFYPYQVFSVLASAIETRSNADVVSACIDELEITSQNRETARAELARLKMEFNKTNRMLTAFQQSDFARLLEENSDCIINLMIIMGPARGLALLATIASISARQFEHFLGLFKGIYDADLIAYLKSILANFTSSLTDKKLIGAWKEILLVLATFSASSTKEQWLIRLQALQVDQAITSLALVLSNLNAIATTISIALLELPIDANEIDQAKLAILAKSRYWNNLVTGKRKLATYTDWHTAMLVCDITQRSLDVMLHDTQQTDTCTLVIAKHNANIRTELTAAGLNAETAIYYRKSHAFTYTEPLKADIDWEVVGNNMLEKLEALKRKLKQSKLIDDKHIKGLYNDISKLLNELTKGTNWISRLDKRIKSPLIETLLISLQNKLRRLNNASGKLINSLDLAITEYLQFKHQMHTRQFRAKVWDKTDPTTFLLGNYLDCCLAADGRQAQTMIERRLDDAMPIQVVIDEATNEPVSAAWSFWAVDNIDKKLKLVVNYFELNNNHSKDRNLSNTLVGNLIYFIGELYLKDVAHEVSNTPKMVMRYLTYGNIRNFSTFETTRCKFTQKLGGFCPRTNGNPSLYYLNALDCDVFHLYSFVRLQQEFPNALQVTAVVAQSSVKATLFGDSVSAPKADQSQSSQNFTRLVDLPSEAKRNPLLGNC